MLISQMIKKLEAVREVHGDLELMLASDEEGNHWREVLNLRAEYFYDDGYEGETSVHNDDVGTEYDLEDLTLKVGVW